jgi:peptidoglycan/LPS O-acetylase OafA/YrhL
MNLMQVNNVETICQPSIPAPFISAKYRADIDGLRAIAVLLVVGFHAFPNWLKGGFIGVDIFFVISGFLISTIILENLRQDRFSFGEFYGRRIRRIFPALILVLFTCFMIGWNVLDADEFIRLGKNITGGVGFVSNFVLWNESGYFDNSAETKPLLHLWSLGVEEQFYLFWPLFLWFAYKKRINLFAATLAVAVASFATNIYSVDTNGVAAFYAPWTRFWELLVGSLLVNMPVAEFGKRIGKSLGGWQVQSFLGIGLIICGLAILDKDNAFPGWWAIFPTLGAALLISADSQAWLNRVFLSNRGLVWFGKISFPLYLWHWPLLSFARIVNGEWPPFGTCIAVVAISVVLAWLTYIFIEKPIRFDLHVNNHRIHIVLLVVLLIVGLLGYSCTVKNGFPTREVAQKTSDFSSIPEEVDYEGCQAKGLLGDERLSFCFVNSKKTDNAAIIGDSHAEDKFYGIEKLDKNRTWMLAANSSCPPVYGVSVEGDQKNCQAKSEGVVDWLIAQKEIKTVLLSSYGNYFLTTSYAADHIQNKRGPDTIKISSIEIKNKSREDTFFYGLNNTVGRLQKAGKQVIVAVDVPELPFFPKDCVNKNLKCEISIQEAMDRQKAHRAMIKRLQELHPSMLVFDPIDLFCHDGFCSFRNKQTVLYKDSHHLTMNGSNFYASNFVEWLNARTHLEASPNSL